MTRDLHDMDENFRSAYQEFADDPSPHVLEKINAGLDKKDAASYKKRSRNWKRVAILSILLLAGFILYEAGILKTGFSHARDSVLIAEAGKKSGENAEKHKETITSPNPFLPAQSNKKESRIVTKKISGKI